MPLADKIRPSNFDEIVGQKHLVGEKGVLRKIAMSDQIPNMIFYGPSGVGKTTVAEIISKMSNKVMCKVNATNTTTAEIKDIIASSDGILGTNGVLLYLDEIQYLNKKQQQSLLESTENGKVTLIASTTENPHFYVYNAILSRSVVFEFKPVDSEDIIDALKRALNIYNTENRSNYSAEEDALKYISRICVNDVRQAINILELSILVSDNELITLDTVQNSYFGSGLKYDMLSDEHYNLLSAFQKSIRGSDENAALHYLARLLSAGDLISVCRRLLVIASEDVGLAYSQASSIVKSLTDTAVQLGLPEAQIPLAHAVILLATSPKSNSAVSAIGAAMTDVMSGNYSDVPDHLKDAHYEGAKQLGRGVSYNYPHSYENNYVNQQYLPDKIKDAVYYEYGKNKNEQSALEYWRKIKNKK